MSNDAIGSRDTSPSFYWQRRGAVLSGGCSTGFAYLRSFQVIDAAVSSTASGASHVSPLTAVIVGTSFPGEHLLWFEPAGAVIVFVGYHGDPGSTAMRLSHVVPRARSPVHGTLIGTTLWAAARVNRGAIDHRP